MYAYMYRMIELDVALFSALNVLTNGATFPERNYVGSVGHCTHHMCRRDTNTERPVSPANYYIGTVTIFDSYFGTNSRFNYYLCLPFLG